MPTSIYLSRQVDFFAAKPIDNYSTLSTLDLEARTRRLTFRLEVEAHTALPELKEFDGPLLTALHSNMDSSVIADQIPRLPNGFTVRNKWQNTMPVRHVTVGLGEGMGRLRREYFRLQHARQQRKANEALANRLSFEDDAVFASGDEGSSPSSGVVPESLVAEDGVDDTNEWGRGWEEEYQRAVEDDGDPYDLVVGMLDEEEEGQRKWERYRHGETG